MCFGDLKSTDGWVWRFGQVLIEVLEEAEIVQWRSSLLGKREVITLGPEVVNPVKGLRSQPIFHEVIERWVVAEVCFEELPVLIIEAAVFQEMVGRD